MIPSADDGLADGNGPDGSGNGPSPPRTPITLSYKPTTCQSPPKLFPIVDAHPATQPAPPEAKVSTSAQQATLNPLQ